MSRLSYIVEAVPFHGLSHPQGNRWPEAIPLTAIKSCGSGHSQWHFPVCFEFIYVSNESQALFKKILLHKLLVWYITMHRTSKRIYIFWKAHIHNVIIFKYMLSQYSA